MIGLSFNFRIDDDDSGEEEDNEISQKQRELEEMINRQQAELARIQQEREAEDERVGRPRVVRINVKGEMVKTIRTKLTSPQFNRI